MPLPGRGSGAKQPLLGGAESSSSSSLVASKVRLHMSCIPSWLTILLFVAPCHRAGDLTTESTQIGIAAGGASDDKNAQKYLPSTKSFVAEWSFEKPLWRNVNSTIPQMREEAATWSDPDSGDWWLFGGHRNIMSKKGSHVNKEKIMKKNRLEKNMAKHDASGGLMLPITTKYYSDLWHYQPSLRLWTRIYPSSSSSIPAPGGPDHPLTRPILCGGGGNKPSPLITGLESDDSNRNNNSNTSNESLTEGTSKVGKVDGRVMAVYAPGSKPVDTVWLLEMNDTRLWTTYVCCDEDSSMTEKSDKVQEDRKGKTDELGSQEKASGRESTNSDQEKSANGDIKNPAQNASFEEGPLTFCPDFHTLTRPPITWCDKQSQALFALDITSFKPRTQDQENPQNFSLAQNNTNEAQSTEKETKAISWIPRLWRFDLGLTQWEHISVKNLTKFSDLWKCGQDTSTMHWTSLDKCLIVLCPVLGGPSNLFHSLSMCMEGDGPKLQTLGTIQLSQGASQAHQWTISAVESSLSGRKYLLLAYGRLLDLWVLEQGSKNWSPLENIWQGAALKWFRANMGLYHLQIVEDGIVRDKKENEEEEEDKVDELEEGKALGIAHLGEIGINSFKKYNSSKFSFISSKNKILASSIRKEGMMEVFMVNPRDGVDITLREQGLFIIRISEDNGTIFGKKAEAHNKNAQEKEFMGNEKDIELTTLPGQPTDEVLNLSSQASSKKDDENIKNEFTETSDIFYLPTTTITLRAEEGESEIYDQNQGENEEEDDEWSAELVLETNGSSPVLNASLLALVEGGGNVEIDDGLGKEANPRQNGIDGSQALNHLSTDKNINLNQISDEPLVEASAMVNLEQDQADKMGVIRPLSIEENEMGRGSIALGAFGSEEGGYQGTILFFAVSFSMFMLFVVVVFLRRFVVTNCQFASHHLPHRCRSNSSVLLKEPPPIRYSVIPDEVCYAGMNSGAMPAPGSPIPPSSIHSTLSKPLTT